jgi:hypothetical protein
MVMILKQIFSQCGWLLIYFTIFNLCLSGLIASPQFLNTPLKEGYTLLKRTPFLKKLSLKNNQNKHYLPKGTHVWIHPHEAQNHTSYFYVLTPQKELGYIKKEHLYILGEVFPPIMINDPTDHRLQSDLEIDTSKSLHAALSPAPFEGSRKTWMTSLLYNWNPKLSKEFWIQIWTPIQIDSKMRYRQPISHLEEDQDVIENQDWDSKSEGLKPAKTPSLLKKLYWGISFRGWMDQKHINQQKLHDSHHLGFNHLQSRGLNFSGLIAYSLLKLNFWQQFISIQWGLSYQEISNFNSTQIYRGFSLEHSYLWKHHFDIKKLFSFSFQSPPTSQVHSLTSQFPQLSLAIGALSNVSVHMQAQRSLQAGSNHRSKYKLPHHFSGLLLGGVNWDF